MLIKCRGHNQDKIFPLTYHHDVLDTGEVDALKSVEKLFLFFTMFTYDDQEEKRF